MTKTAIILTIFLFSCGEQTNKEKKEEIKKNKKDTINIFTKNKQCLDSLFQLKKDSADFSSEDIQTTLFIGHLFTKDTKHAVLRYKENDTTSNVFVFQESGKYWDTIFSIKIFPVRTGPLEQFIEIKDFNSDKIPDLKVIKTSWEIHPGETSDLWIFNNNKFNKVESFDKIVSATYDSSTKLIYSYHSNGCADMAMYFGTFQITKDKIKKIKEMNCDCCENYHDSCKIQVFGQKPYMVSYKTAYMHVPKFFAEGVKWKCGLIDDK